jgi:IS6 family transposase
MGFTEINGNLGVYVMPVDSFKWKHSPEIEKKVRKYLKQTNDSWRMDETYIRVKGKWKYLYRAVDSNGNLSISC